MSTNTAVSLPWNNLEKQIISFLKEIRLFKQEGCPAMEF